MFRRPWCCKWPGVWNRFEPHPACSEDPGAVKWPSVWKRFEPHSTCSDNPGAGFMAVMCLFPEDCAVQQSTQKESAVDHEAQKQLMEELEQLRSEMHELHQRHEAQIRDNAQLSK